MFNAVETTPSAVDKMYVWGIPHDKKKGDQIVDLFQGYNLKKIEECDSGPNAIYKKSS